MNLNCVIVDDEKSGRENLRKLLAKLAPDLKVLGTASSVDQAVELILVSKPEIVFLDVEMPSGTGFDVLRMIEARNFEVIFVTAHPSFAVEAFSEAAIDFLLKPINLGALKRAVDRAKEKIQLLQKNDRIDKLLSSMQEQGSKERLALPNREGIELVPISDILYCEADGNYTKIQMRNGEQKLVSKPLSHLDEELPTQLFMRIHKSFTINLKEVLQYKTGKGGQVQMSNGDWMDVSRNRKQDLLDKLR